MIELLKTKSGHLTLIAIHLVLGVFLKFAPIVISLAYLTMFVWFAFEVVYLRDRHSRAGFYALYLMGFEMVYRMAGGSFSWELGKYVSILILLIGIIVGPRKYISYTFLFLFILLIPSIFLSESSSPESLRKIILFNLSGPLSLVFAGFYFYRRPVNIDDYIRQLKFAFLPAFTIIAALSVVANVATLEFTSLQSSFEAAGGFGPNQVSTVLGWFILLALLYKVNNNLITPFNWLDWIILFYLFLRALITFSRGGVMGCVLALSGAVLVLYFSSPGFRGKMKKATPYLIFGIVFLIGVFVFANKITNNYLLYRYQGYSTNEILRGAKDKGGGSILTGRDRIMEADIKVFLDHPVLGVGYGMGEKYRAMYFRYSAAAHTEFSRLLSENGILGLLYMLIGMIVLPIIHFIRVRDTTSRFFFVGFYLLSMFTMFHAAMRLALPGILFGAAFMHVLAANRKQENQRPSNQESLAIEEEVLSLDLNRANA